MNNFPARSPINAVVRIPSSKSITHRSLIAAGLAEGESLVEKILVCDDTLYTVNALKQLGVSIAIRDESAAISGTGGVFVPAPAGKEIYLGDSGTSFRLLLSTVALARGEFTLKGSPRMEERPIADLVGALNHLGVNTVCSKQNGFPPICVKANGIVGGRVSMTGDISSQYISSILLASPYAQKDVEISVGGKLASRPYVDLTIEVMERFGVKIIQDGYRHFKTHCGQRYQPRQFTVEGDLSSASYFWAAAAVTGGTVTTHNIRPIATLQGDVGLLDIFQKMGCHIEKENDRVTVHGKKLSGIEVDMSAMPDMVPTLAAVALFAKGRTVIRNVAHLVHKESNRLKAVATEWRRVGGQVEELQDGLVILGQRPLHGLTVKAHNDHRIAMSLAVIGLNVPDIKIAGDECVNKSFPGFWGKWNALKDT